MCDNFNEIQVAVSKLTNNPTISIKECYQRVTDDFENLETVVEQFKETLDQDVNIQDIHIKDIHILAFLQTLNNKLSHEWDIKGMTDDEISALKKTEAFYQEGENRRICWDKLVSAASNPIKNLFKDEIKSEGELEAVKLIFIPNPDFDNDMNLIFALCTALNN